MVQVIWTKRAVADLDSIGKYIAIDSEYAAQKFVQELIKKAETPINYPEKGRPIPEKITENTNRYFTEIIALFIN
jgi:plasmid stabilization system protein ParE